MKIITANRRTARRAPNVSSYILSRQTSLQSNPSRGSQLLRLLQLINLLLSSSSSSQNPTFRNALTERPRAGHSASLRMSRGSLFQFPMLMINTGSRGAAEQRPSVLRRPSVFSLGFEDFPCTLDILSLHHHHSSRCFVSFTLRDICCAFPAEVSCPPTSLKNCRNEAWKRAVAAAVGRSGWLGAHFVGREKDLLMDSVGEGKGRNLGFWLGQWEG